MVTFLIGLLLLMEAAIARTWVSADGSSSFDGEYISHTETKVTLIKAGREISFSRDLLSEKDGEWLNTQDEIKKKEAKIKASKKGELETHELAEAKVKTWCSYLPPSYSEDGDEFPVCFLYSPGGKSISIVKRMMPTADALGWVLIGIDAYSNKRVKAESSAGIAKDCQLIRDLALKEYHVDESKSVYGGMSGGGWWSFASTNRLDGKVAAVLSFGGWMSKEYDKDYPKNLAVAIVNGDKDEGARSWELKDMEFLKRKTRADVKMFHFPGKHVLAPSEECLKAASWIHETKGF